MKFYLMGIAVSLISYLFAFIATDNHIVGIVVGVIFLLYFLLYGSRILLKHFTKRNEYQDCLMFINNYLLLNKEEKDQEKNIIHSLDSLSKEFQSRRKQYDLKTLDLNSLKSLFNFNIYSMFLSLEDNAQLDNILLMVLSQKEALNNKEEKMRKTTVKFILLWCLPMVVFTLVKFLINKFYKAVVASPIYIVGIGIIFSFLLLSIHLFIRKIIIYDYEVSYEKN